MSAYDEIRSALDDGFSVDNLRKITNLALNLLQDKSLEHPAICQAIATTCRWVADSWDDVPLQASVAARVEGDLISSIVFLLEAADKEDALVGSALDNLAKAFRDAIRSGLDTTLE